MGDPVILLAMLGCFGNSEEDLTPQINGTITTAEASGDVAIYKAFGFHVDNKALFYMTSTPDADCPSVAEYLTEKQVDPAGIWEGGTCNISAVVWEYDADGATFTMEGGEANFDITWSVKCALGEGSFEWTKRDEDSEDTDYFWVGDDAYEWLGSGDEFEATFSGAGTADDPYVIDITDMTAFDGNYPTIIEGIPADGTVSGSIEAQTCSQLLGAGIFPS